MTTQDEHDLIELARKVRELGLRQDPSTLPEDIIRDLRRMFDRGDWVAGGFRVTMVEEEGPNESQATRDFLLNFFRKDKLPGVHVAQATYFGHNIKAITFEEAAGWQAKALVKRVHEAACKLLPTVYPADVLVAAVDLAGGGNHSFIAADMIAARRSVIDKEIARGWHVEIHDTEREAMTARIQTALKIKAQK